MPVKLKALPAREAVEFFRQKGYRITFDWRDMDAAEHQAAFTVAKAMKVDLLAEIRGMVDGALEQGTTFADFRKELQPELLKRGWWGKAQMLDPETGESKLVQLGSTRRLKVIYDTNLRTAHTEGQWERIQGAKESFPYLVYDANNSEQPRAEHSAWDGLVLPADAPFWREHMPIKEWGCKCRVRQLSQSQLERRGLSVSDPPRVPTYTYVNKRTGEVQRVPRGVHPAFHYPPGGRRAHLEQMLDEKTAALPRDLRDALDRTSLP